MEPTKATLGKLLPNPKLKLLDQVREVRRRRQFSLRTEEAYVGWVRAAAKKNFQQPSLCGSADLPIGSFQATLESSRSGDRRSDPEMTSGKRSKRFLVQVKSWRGEGKRLRETRRGGGSGFPVSPGRGAARGSEHAESGVQRDLPLKPAHVRSAPQLFPVLWRLGQPAMVCWCRISSMK